MKRLTPPQLIVLAYLIAISIGAILLCLPVAAAPGKNISFLDAFFTSTSAVCVTGLVVVDTGSAFSLFGQCVILFLFQIGGLGIMTISTAIALFIGKKLSLRERVALKMGLDFTQEGIGKLVKKIIIIVFFVEMIFAFWLFISFGGFKDPNPLKVAYISVFHSVSAFCNAGFSTMSNSFVGYKDNVGALLGMMMLIICGGLGFIVILDVFRNITKRRRFFRLELQSKIVLLTTGALLFLGFIFYFLFETHFSMYGFSLKERIFNSFFQSVTCRTAGFNTVNMNEMNPASHFFTVLLMFIGASPGSTGGGIKTCTFIIVVAFLISIFRDRKDVFIMKRTIPRKIVWDALFITTMALSWIIFVTIMLTMQEQDKSFISILFEAVSAFGTVGLSLGITPFLTFWGKILIIITMLIGRIGLLILVLALMMKGPETPYKYPEEKVMVG